MGTPRRGEYAGQYAIREEVGKAGGGQKIARERKTFLLWQSAPAMMFTAPLQHLYSLMR
jgi:hypothetical protein